MLNIQPRIFRDQRGSVAGEVELAIDSASTKILRIVAMKRSNGLVVCQAQVNSLVKGSDKDGGAPLFSYAPFSDYNKVIATEKRCTEVNVRALMDLAISQADQLVREAREFYRKKGSQQ
jgi:hypothetical protein